MSRKSLIKNKIGLICVISLAFFSFLGLFFNQVSLSENYAYIYLCIILLAYVCSLFVIFDILERNFLDPMFLFCFSTTIFVLSRPILYIVLDKKPIEATGYTILGLLNATSAVILIYSIVFVFIFSFSCSKKITNLFNYNIKLNGFNIVSVCFFIFAAFCSVKFLYESYSAAQKIGAASYFDLASNGDFYHHIIYFSILKMVAIFAALILGTKKCYTYTSFFIFISSIGFILIGLRGYPVSFLFSFLVILSLSRKIPISSLVIIGLLTILMAGMVLEYRIGYQIFDSKLELVFMPIFQQGATFEAVYGAVNNIDALRECVSFFDFYFSGVNFGSCIDSARGVYFSEGGGFASSFFAEVWYLGWIGVVTYSLGLAIALSLVSKVYKSILNKDQEFSERFGIFLLITSIPNIVYIGRSSSYDAILKVFLVVIILVILSLFIKKLSRSVN